MPMSRNDLEKLPCYDYIAKDKGSRPVDCAVCLENFNMGDTCRLLPVGKHSFHVQCVDTWLLKTPICPICRTRAGSDGGSSVMGEESSHFSETSIEFRESPTNRSSQPNGIIIEVRENSSETCRLGEINLELRETSTGSSHLVGDNGIESSENQRARNLCGFHLSVTSVKRTKFHPTVQA
ncbi:RING-H2 finger protein [Quillaja saponaria]|uniref:RING-type E3 ubiquitin transferase n=1 Tax=Quillaja saponaria TaxID=32244 RepID=A0AAD7Q458_QUISA|nr:RING-H2 finger protein [Quillaja saponaria]